MTENNDLDRPMTKEEELLYRQRQKSRAKIMAFILVGLCALFYLITIAKIGMFG